MKELFIVLAGNAGVAVVFYGLAAAERILRFDPNDPGFVPQFRRHFGLGYRPGKDGKPGKITAVRLWPHNKPDNK